MAPTNSVRKCAQEKKAVGCAVKTETPQAMNSNVQHFPHFRSLDNKLDNLRGRDFSPEQSYRTGLLPPYQQDPVGFLAVVSKFSVTRRFSPKSLIFL